MATLTKQQDDFLRLLATIQRRIDAKREARGQETGMDPTAGPIPAAQSRPCRKAGK